MSLAAEWDAAVPIASKPSPAEEWDDAKPVKLPKAAAPKATPKANTDALPNAALGGPEVLANMATGMLAKPLSDVAGLAATGKEMVSPTPGGGNPAGFRDAVREGLTYQPRTAAGQHGAENNPFAMIAKLLSSVSRGAGRTVAGPDPGPGRAALSYGVEEGVNQLPALAGAGGGGPGAAAAKSGARDLMQSALKPSAKALQTGKADRAITTMLDEGVNVSKGGVEKLRAMIDDKNSAISKLIENSPEVIDKKATAAYLDDAVKRFEKQVNPLDDLAQIQKAWDEFLAVHPDKIPVKQAQELKQGTYRALGDKQYGEVKGASVEAQKTLARGLKEEIAKAVPQVRKLNAEESELLNALSLVEKRVAMSANKNPMGLSLLTTSPTKWAAFMADRSEAFKSVMARMLNTAGDVAPATLPPLGAAITSQTGQLPPPPP